MTNPDDLAHLRNLNATLTETTIEQSRRDRIRETMGVVAVMLIAGLLALAWGQATFGRDDFRPRELR
jgi:hypothetical protein